MSYPKNTLSFTQPCGGGGCTPSPCAAAIFDSPVASHADMQLLALDTKTVLLSPYQPQLKAQLSQLGLTVLTGPALEKEYPRDVPYNALRLGNHYICNHKTVSAVARSHWQKRDAREIAVKQGYAQLFNLRRGRAVDHHSRRRDYQSRNRCGLVRFADSAGIHPNPKYDTGFIGGCSGRTDDAVIFTGKLESHLTVHRCAALSESAICKLWSWPTAR